MKPSKKICWLMIFVLLFVWSGLVQHPLFAKGRDGPNVEETGKLENLLQALEQAYNELPKETFDPDAVLENVGEDPAEIFEWVRTSTYLVPYRGSLRGPRGVLMDGFGNSLDRALLLHELLQLAGHEVRLVNGTLAKEKASQVLKSRRIIPEETERKTSRSDITVFDRQIEESVRKYRLKRQEVRDVFEKQMQDQERIEKKVVERVKEQTSMIKDKIKNFREKEYADKKVWEIDVLRDHWWVQWQKDNSWVDLDPTLPNAKAGETLAELRSTCDADDLAEDRLHLVTIRILVERLEEGTLLMEHALEYKIRPSDVFGDRIILRHIPVSLSEDFSLFEKENPNQVLMATVRDEEEWLPILNIGSKQITACSFYKSGAINDKPGGKSQAGGVQRVTGGLFGALAGKEEEKKDSTLTAEWIEYEIHVPGEPSVKIQRQIFDLIGPAVRSQRDIGRLEISERQQLERGLSLLSEIEIFLQVCHLSPEFFAHLIAQNLLANRGVLLELFERGTSITGNELADKTKEFVPLPGPEYSMAIARQEWSRFGSSLYLDRPNIICYHRLVSLGTKGELVARHGFDIVSNDVAVLPSSGENPFDIRLEQGVLETNAEAIMVGRPDELTENTADLFAKSTKLGIKWLAIKDIRDPAWQEMKLSEDVRYRIENDLASGYAVIAPEKPIPIQGQSHAGWWRINLKTGGILGVMESGGGQALSQNAIQLLKHAAATCLIFAIVYFGAGQPPGQVAASCLFGASLGSLAGAAWLPGLARVFKVIIIALVASKVFMGS